MTDPWSISQRIGPTLTGDRLWKSRWRDPHFVLVFPPMARHACINEADLKLLAGATEARKLVLQSQGRQEMNEL